MPFHGEAQGGFPSSSSVRNYIPAQHAMYAERRGHARRNMYFIVI
jgi:hypothetical protein